MNLDLWLACKIKIPKIVTLSKMLNTVSPEKSLAANLHQLWEANRNG